MDCGIKAIEQVNYAKEMGIDFIICDHHLPDNKIPKAVAVLDPKREDCSYPFKELCGCGIGFKLIQALQMHLGFPDSELSSYLDLVAIASIQSTLDDSINDKQVRVIIISADGPTFCAGHDLKELTLHRKNSMFIKSKKLKTLLGFKKLIRKLNSSKVCSR